MHLFNSFKLDFVAPSAISASLILVANNKGVQSLQRKLFLGQVCNRNRPLHVCAVDAPCRNRNSTTLGSPRTAATHNAVNDALEDSCVRMSGWQPLLTINSSTHCNIALAVVFRLLQTSTKKFPPVDIVLLYIRFGPNSSRIEIILLFVKEFLVVEEEISQTW